MNYEVKKRQWIRKGFESGEFKQKLSDIIENPKIDFKVGDKVTYTNDYGVSFPDITIIAISKQNNLWKYGNCIHLNKDSYWYPVKPESLKIEREI